MSKEWFGHSDPIPFCPGFVPTGYQVEVVIHIIESFKNTKFVNRRHRYQAIFPSFRVSRNMVLSDSDTAESDPDLTVDNALFHGVIVENLRALAKSAYDSNKRSVVLCNLVLEAPDGYHVKKVGMASVNENIPVVAKVKRP